MSLQLIDKATNAPVHLSDVKLKLYVINGQQLASSGPSEPPMGLYLSDDGHPLFAAACTTPEDDKGVPIEQVQVCPCSNKLSGLLCLLLYTAEGVVMLWACQHRVCSNGLCWESQCKHCKA